MSDEVRAAGAVLWRPNGGPPGSSGEAADNAVIAVIHRPKYDDWSLPKGKLDPGEDDREAAVREVHEETAAHGQIVRDLGEVRYEVTKQGVTSEKVVRYFDMRVTGADEFRPNDEVDELRWLTVDDADALLSYDRDREVVQRFRGD